ncbi:TPA: metallophosphoesterase [Candidatus Scatousia excrementigallinarum]|uniref:Metallophosphoesterase n=1 Tax=Candidatus Scatousia excrementigallinarum TaxID=2840935 RepID=A0A9D1EYH4_9BACT|nr:metallophosphoesterase [Candidatus Scatousia excrementigallinarum]
MKRKYKKKETFLTKLMNAVITLVLSGIMIYGLQCYSASDLKFVQLSDVHFSDAGVNTTFKMTGESPKLLEDAVNQINEISDVNFVMLTGDQVNVPYEKELQAFLKYAEKIKAPWYVVFGNHDRCVGGYLTKELYFDIVAKHNENFKYKTPYYSFVPRKGYKVIVLDTIIDDKVTSNGRIYDEELVWLDKQLKESQKDVVLIFMHVPIIEPFPSSGHRLLNAGEVQGIIEKYKNPIAVFAGHYHAAKITQNENVLYVASPALVSYPNAFRVVTVRNERKKVVFNIEMRETREKNIQKLAKLLVFGSNVYMGEEKDRNGIYEIKKN